jgi:pimeloyl-ACP methyl ester carboxylesterase
MTEDSAAPRTYAAAVNRLLRHARQGQVDTGRYRCRYYDWGEGPALVFVNGLGDEPRSFALPMALLAPHFRCIAYELPTGRGDGARLLRYRLEHLSADLQVLLEHLRIEQATPLGHSFGALVALLALGQQPRRFQRGVLVSGFAARPLSRWHWWLATFGRFLPNRAELRHLRGRRASMRRKHFVGFERHEPQRWEQFMELTGRAPMRTTAHWGRLLHEMDLRSLLPRIHQPVLLIHGDADPLVPPRHQEELFRGLPNAVMFQLHHCGHLPMYTHPEALASALLTFHGMLPPGELVHDCGAGPDASGRCPTTGEACLGKEVAAEPVPASAPATEAEPAAKA